MHQFRLSGSAIGKSFSRRRSIFQNVDFNLSNGSSISITGRNGSGKSTLLKVISGIFDASEGKLEFELNSTIEKNRNLKDYIGYVAPYLVLYEEFTILEFLKIITNLEGKIFEKERAEDMIDYFGLYGRRNDEIRTFSSGMKQRVKYMYALLKSPLILMLDEPFTNLDLEGIEKIEELTHKHLEAGGAVMVATNDEREKAMCEKEINLLNF